MEPIFRIATDADPELRLAMMREYYAYDGHAYDEARARVALVTFLREPSFGRAWLICDAETPVGYIVLTFGYSLEYLGRDAFIDELYLRESHRGQGWGSQTLKFVENEARASDVRSIHLEVVRTNVTANEFYRRAGHSDHAHFLMSKWIEQGFAKPTPGSHRLPLRALPAALLLLCFASGRPLDLKLPRSQLRRTSWFTNSLSALSASPCLRSEVCRFWPRISPPRWCA